MSGVSIADLWFGAYWSFPPGLCVPKDGREEIVWFWIVRHIAGSKTYIFWFTRGVLSGKHYEQLSMHCHKVMVQGLERLLLDTVPLKST